MTQSAAITALLLLALLLANWPFFSARFLLLGPHKAQQPVYLLLEILFAYALFLASAWGLEGHFGQVQPQGWQFYAVSFCLFLCMGFPGLVCRYLLKK